MDERSSLGTVSKRECFFRNARARNTHVEATLNHPFAAQAYDFVGRPDIFGELDYWCGAGAFGGARSRDCVFNLCTDGAPCDADTAVYTCDGAAASCADLEAAGADCTGCACD